MTRALALSDHQLRFIQHAAKPLPVEARAQFLQKVASLLADKPTNAAVVQATNIVLDALAVDIDAKS